MKSVRRIALCLLLAGALAVSPCGVLADEPPEQPSPTTQRQQAEALYADGRYPEARKLLEALDAAGEADGPLLYRLAYCQRVSGDPAARETQLRARQSLEQGLAEARGLEVPFYLVNTYQNLGQTAEIRRVASETTARVERGELPRPETKVDMFRMGKLYADQGLEQQAAEWYARSIDESTGELSASDSYVRWASRFLAEKSFRDEEYSAADKYFTILTASEEATKLDYHRLAVARARTGKFAEASEAWQQAINLDPADANRPRYCSALAKMAERLGGLPEKSPSGGPWSALTKEDLERLMSEQAEIVKQAIAEAQQAETLEPDKRNELKGTIAQAKPLFVAAAMEYALRGHSIREVAFFGGYAPLILQPRAWRLGRN